MHGARGEPQRSRGHRRPDPITAPRFHLLLLAGILLAPGCAHGPAALPARLRTVDVLPDLWRFWEAERAAPRAEQLQAFRRTVIGPHAALFGPDVFAGPPADKDVERLLVELPRLEPRLRALWERMPGALQRARSRFAERFPSFAWAGPVALSLSFSQFEAVWRTVEGQQTLVLGLDALAFYRGAYTDLAPLLDLTLARAVVPDWTGPDAEPLWSALWRQGFPLYVARALHPEASDKDLGLAGRPSVEDPAFLAALARRLLPALDSVRASDLRALLSSGASASPGAILGARVADRIGAGRTLEQTAQLTGPALRSAIAAVLETLESPGS